MKSISTFCLSLLLPALIISQTQIWQVPAVGENLQLRNDTSTIFASQTIDVPVDGKVFVKFDGNCISSPGDRIVIGASDIPDWRTNDGNIGVYVSDSAYTLTCFSHSQVFDVTAGTHTYYAVAQNYVDTDGTGIASIDGNLTVIYVPGNSETEKMNNAIIVDGPLTWAGDVYDFTQVEIVAPVKGKIFVNFDGTFYMNSEEKGLITTNLSSDWPGHPEMTSVELSTEHDFANFTHRKVYEVEAGTFQVHALAKKTEGGFDPFYDYLYGALTAHFIADDLEETSIYSDLVTNNTVTDNNAETVSEIQFEAPSNGSILLQFTGQISSSLDDRINVTLRENDNPSEVLGQVAIQPILLLNPQTFFSVSGFAEVSEGAHAYEVVVEYDDVSNGSGTANLSGFFTIHYVEAASTSVRDEFRNDLDVMVYPNPTDGMLFGQVLNTNDPSASTITLYNASGEKVSRIVHEDHGLFQEDLSELPDGQYLVRIEQGGHYATHTIVKMGRK